MATLQHRKDSDYSHRGLPVFTKRVLIFTKSAFWAIGKNFSTEKVAYIVNKVYFCQ